MKFTNSTQIENFLKAVNQCRGDVWLESPYGDKFNLNSSMSTYVAIGKMLEENGEQLELFCSDREDEQILLRFMNTNNV